MDEIEQQINEMVERYVEQIRPFTDRIAQLEAENGGLRNMVNSYQFSSKRWEEITSKLEASNKKLREAIDAIYDPNCDCYLCVTFREALEE
jgi:predicted nuclease with TOPRIM domain